MTEDAFAAEARTRDAVIRNMETLGGAAGKLPEGGTARAPRLPWRHLLAGGGALASSPSRG